MNFMQQFELQQRFFSKCEVSMQIRLCETRKRMDEKGRQSLGYRRLNLKREIED